MTSHLSKEQALELEDALPLANLLAPVGEAKDAIVSALDALLAEPFEPAESGAAAVFMHRMATMCRG